MIRELEVPKTSIPIAHLSDVGFTKSYFIKCHFVQFINFHIDYKKATFKLNQAKLQTVLHKS